MIPASKGLMGTIPTRIIDVMTTFGRGEPCYIPVISNSRFKSGFCYENVNKKIQNHGGSIVFGWCIWQTGNLYLTAEFHAVWRNKQGKLIDITEKPDGEKQIVYVPDEGTSQADFDFNNCRPPNQLKRIYQGSNVELTRMIDNMIDLLSKRNAIMKPTPNGTITNDLQAYKRLTTEFTQILHRIEKILE
jgi:hypothetical protein